jgi:hypothetical protein
MREKKKKVGFTVSKLAGVEINAERSCQNAGPSICFTESLKPMHGFAETTTS